MLHPSHGWQLYDIRVLLELAFMKSNVGSGASACLIVAWNGRKHMPHVHLELFSDCVSAYMQAQTTINIHTLSF